jgi:hypothetical protein
MCAGVVTTVAGSGVEGYTNSTGKSAEFNSMYGICLYDQSLIVCDSGNNALRRISLIDGVYLPPPFFFFFFFLLFKKISISISQLE